MYNVVSISIFTVADFVKCSVNKFINTNVSILSILTYLYYLPVL